MADKTGIEWTDATWNPTTGCTPISAGCDHCYANTLAEGKLAKVYGARLPVVDTPQNRADTFAVRLWPERLGQLESWKAPRMVFVNSMSDLFHKDVPVDFLRRVFSAMLATPRHIKQVLTKRPGRMAAFVKRNVDLFPDGVPAHIWMGTSIENDENVYRARQLREVPAAVRFLSCEPLLGSVAALDLTGIHWVIGGGESGAGYRPVDPTHARELRDLCAAAGVPFFWKQWGGHTPKAGGRLLDGMTHDGFPGVSAASPAAALVAHA